MTNSIRMKRIITLVISIVVVICSCTSCFTMMAVAAATSGSSKLGSERMNTTVKTFQRLAGPVAMATTEDGDVVCVVADFGEYYDGMTLKGKFYRRGTYPYVTTSGINKTVLVYLYGPDRKKLESYTEQFLSEKQNIVVDDSKSKVTVTNYKPI